MNSIRRHLTGRLLLGCLLLLGAGGAAICLFAREVLLNEFDGSLQTAAAALTELTKQTRQVEFGLPLDVASNAPPPQTSHFFEFWLADGRMLKRSPSLGAADLPFRADSHARPQYWNLTLPNGEPGRAVGMKYVPSVEKHGKHRTLTPLEVVLVVARDRSALDRTIRSLIGVLTLGVVLLSAGIVGIVRLTVRRGLAPLEKVAVQTAAIDATSLQLRFPTDVPAELLPIVARLNEFLARIEESFTRERRFSADVAHELRTPIAELRLLADVALKWPHDANATKRAFQDTLDAARQMELLVTGLLTLARCEANREPGISEPVIVSHLVGEIWAPLAEKASVKKLAVTFDIPAQIELATEPTMFRAILANLLDNAVEYSPEAGDVRIEAREDGGSFALTISNTAKNLNAEDIGHLFERFWRKDSARSDGRHSGLGLPLTRAFAEQLGLRVQASLGDSSILTMRIQDSATRRAGSSLRSIVAINGETQAMKASQV